jgi:hypothetical protein
MRFIKHKVVYNEALFHDSFHDNSAVAQLHSVILLEARGSAGPTLTAEVWGILWK